MVGQAAEGLRADDVAIAAADQLDHLAREEPALAHLAAVADEGLHHLLDLQIRRGGMVAGGLAQRVERIGLKHLEVTKQHLHEQLLEGIAAVELDVLEAIVHLEEHEAHQRGHVDLAVLRAQEQLEVVVGQRGVFGVDLAHDAHLDLLGVADLDALEGIHHAAQVVVDVARGIAAFAAELLADVVHPAVHQRVGLPRCDLVGAGLVAQQHQHVAVDQRGQRAAQQPQRDLEAGVLLHAREVDGDDGDLPHARFFERLAQQEDVVGGAAAAARLRHQQRDVVQVVLARLERRDHLPDGEQRGVADVVVDVFEPLVDDGLVGVGQQLHVVAAGAEHLLQDVEMDVRHVGAEQFIGLAHLLGEQDARGFVSHLHSLPSRRWPRTASAGGSSPRPGS